MTHIFFNNGHILLFFSHSLCQKVAQDCGLHALTLATAASLLCTLPEDPNLPRTWSTLHSEMVRKNASPPDPQTVTATGGDSIERSLFTVLDMSLESMGQQERRQFLGLVVLAHGVAAPVPMLASLWSQVRNKRIHTSLWATLKESLVNCPAEG